MIFKIKLNDFQRTIVLIYCIIILGLIIFTIKKHNIENFEMMSSSMKYSNCKDKCLVNYSDDKDKFKTCKSYCKCKNKCSKSFSNKKCKKECKEKKLNLYRDDESKMRKIEIKDKIKKEFKERRKEEKIKNLKEEKENKEKEEEKTHRIKNYINRILNDYMGENDKEHIINSSRGTKKMTKDIKKIFSKYF